MGSPYEESVAGISWKVPSESISGNTDEEPDYLDSIYKSVRPLAGELNKVLGEVAEIKIHVATLEKAIDEQLERKLERKLDEIMKFLNTRLDIKSQIKSAEDDPVDEDLPPQSLMSTEPVEEFLVNPPQDLTSKDEDLAHQSSDKPSPVTEDSSHKNAQNYHGPERLPNGDFNLDAPFRIPRILTEQEKKVLDFWPEVLLPSEVHRYGEMLPENNVSFSSNATLSSINDEVIKVLNDVQKALINSRIPYELWPIRLASIMCGDFHQIACWAKATDLTWLDMVEAILLLLQKNQKYTIPLAPFDKLSSDRKYAHLTDLERLREVFYQLPEHKRVSPDIKQNLMSKIQQNFPRVFLSMQDKQEKLSTAYIIEEAISIDRLLTRSDEADSDEAEDSESNSNIRTKSKRRY